MSNLLREPDSQWWDDALTESVVEDRDQILGQAMRDARDELTRRISVSPQTWTWGHRHRLGERDQLERGRGLRSHVCTGDADGRRPRRPRTLALGEPDRGLGPRSV